jgi:hypothetical protein
MGDLHLMRRFYHIDCGDEVTLEESVGKALRPAAGVPAASETFK